MPTLASEASHLPADLPELKPAPNFKGPLGFLWRVVTSYATSCVILLALMVLTYVGTVTQVELGLIGAQAKYFDSWLWYKEIGSFSLPFPGALLLQTLLAVNLFFGGMLRLRMRAVDHFVLALNVMLLTLLVLRKIPGGFWLHFGLVLVAGLASSVFVYKRRSPLGIMVIHLAMAGLLVAGAVKFQTGNSGYLKLWEGETGNAYIAFHENELVISKELPGGRFEEYIVHDDAFKEMGSNGRGSVELEGVPFKLLLNRYMLNCEPRRASDGSVALLELPEMSMARANLSGLLVTADIPGQAQQSGALWVAEAAPWTLQVEGETWTVGYRRRVRDLPWSMRLEDFIKEEHPGVDTPRVFASDVTRIDDLGEQQFHITMNAPLRYDGFTFSQNNWGPQDPSMQPRDGSRWSMLEVSTNPSDQWPKYGCFVMAYGMIIHFLAKLARYIVRS